MRALGFDRRVRQLYSYPDEDVGPTHVNMSTAHKEPRLPFGAIKFSGTGLPEAGKTGVEFFTRHKVVYMKYR